VEQLNLVAYKRFWLNKLVGAGGNFSRGDCLLNISKKLKTTGAIYG
jgi:hypothetical protein